MELDLDQNVKPGKGDIVAFRGLISDLPYHSDEMIARLLRLVGNAPLRRAYEGEKVTFEVVGRFRGMYFCLYDYKGDGGIHVGAVAAFAPLVPLLRNALLERLRDVRPMPFQAVGHYDYPITRGYQQGMADFRFTPPYPEVL